MTQTERIHRAWREYEWEHSHMPGGARQMSEWAVARGLLDLPPVDPLDVLAGQVSRALREEYRTHKGQRYRANLAVRVTKNGVQTVLWAMTEFATQAHAEMSFSQRREQIIDDCAQLQTDVDVYNDLHPDREAYQLELDFTEDVTERRMRHTLDA
jgi:hypothetical protein